MFKIGRIFWIAMVFLILGGWMIKGTVDNMDTTDGKISFGKAYVTWVAHLGKNIVGAVGYISGQDWLPETNSTNTTKDKG